MLLRCYSSWKFSRPGAYGKATKVIWKKTGPCDLGDSMAHWEWSTLGRTVNELEWALNNPPVWVIDSIMHSTKIGSLGCCAQDMIREYLGCWAQDMKGKSMNRRFPNAYKMLTMLLRCYSSWKFSRPGAYGKATKVIWKKTGPCDRGDSMAHWEWSTLGRTVNELEWALNNPPVWVIDSIMHSTSFNEFGMLRTRYDSGIFGMLSTRHEGEKHEQKVRGCLQIFDHVTTLLQFMKA